ncbi:OLC1v1017096C1 [Oldenlandia corymbosa var. corymbosa]|uniref:OLC1v1017096C1 n=1 Tax=Oldenlandia corymbosa var. corymbosa TaxID=529605 RepID=A0AAV1E8R5_OLDCO|nr:OLC1v1017096C1 [Oldenlandia corymbosa var. corymbosa]
MSTSSSSFNGNDGNTGYLRFERLGCRKYAMRTGFELSKTPKNPNRLYHDCPNHEFIDWVVPIGGDVGNGVNDARRRDGGWVARSHEYDGQNGRYEMRNSNCNCASHEFDGQNGSGVIDSGLASVELLKSCITI